MDRYSRNKVMRLDDEESEEAQCGRVKEGRRDQKVCPKREASAETAPRLNCLGRGGGRWDVLRTRKQRGKATEYCVSARSSGLMQVRIVVSVEVFFEVCA